MPDVYLARGFVAASAALAGAEPVLLHLPGDGGDVVFAALVRADPVDVVTPYGYGGPVGVGEAPPFAAFAEAYAAWCAARGVVSSFVVFHPLCAHAGASASTSPSSRAPSPGRSTARTCAPRCTSTTGGSCGARARRRPTVAVDAAPGRPGRVRRALRGDDAPRGRRAVLLLPAAAYWEALRRDVPLVLVEVRRDGELLAAVLGMGAPPWLHYHLGGAHRGGPRQRGAATSRSAALAEWGREQGYGVLHLGGGVGGRADSLLEYKRRFAPDGLVAAARRQGGPRPRRYLALSGAADAVDWEGFFPAYRAR